MASQSLEERTPLNPSARSSARLGLGEVDVISPGLLHVRFAGAIRVEHFEPLIEAANQQIRLGYKVLIAVDADDVHAYKSEVRQIFQTWLRRNRNDVEKVWILFRSPLIKMGIAMMNSYTGGMIRAFSDSDEFDVELGKATRRARGGWLASTRPSTRSF